MQASQMTVMSHLQKKIASSGQHTRYVTKVLASKNTVTFFAIAKPVREHEMFGEPRYIELITQFSSFVGMESPDWILKGNPIDVDGIAFNIFFKKENETRFYVFADYGQVPNEEADGIYQSLLEANMSMYKKHGPVFSISRKTGNVMYGESHSLEEMTPELLTSNLKKLAKSIQKWRVDYTIEGTGPKFNPHKNALTAQIFGGLQ